MSEREALAVRTAATPAGDDHVRLTLTVTLPGGVHIEPNEPAEPNLVPTVLEVDGLDDVSITYPDPVVRDLGLPGVTLLVIEGTVEFTVRGRVRPGTHRLGGAIRCQPCVGGACLPPRRVPWEAPVTGTSAYSVLGAFAPLSPALQ